MHIKDVNRQYGRKIQRKFMRYCNREHVDTYFRKTRR